MLIEVIAEVCAYGLGIVWLLVWVYMIIHAVFNPDRGPDDTYY